MGREFAETLYYTRKSIKKHIDIEPPDGRGLVNLFVMTEQIDSLPQIVTLYLHLTGSTVPMPSVIRKHKHASGLQKFCQYRRHIICQKKTQLCGTNSTELVDTSGGSCICPELQGSLRIHRPQTAALHTMAFHTSAGSCRRPTPLQLAIDLTIQKHRLLHLCYTHSERKTPLVLRLLDKRTNITLLCFMYSFKAFSNTVKVEKDTATNFPKKPSVYLFVRLVNLFRYAESFCYKTPFVPCHLCVTGRYMEDYDYNYIRAYGTYKPKWYYYWDGWWESYYRRFRVKTNAKIREIRVYNMHTNETLLLCQYDYPQSLDDCCKYDQNIFKDWLWIYEKWSGCYRRFFHHLTEKDRMEIDYEYRHRFQRDAEQLVLLFTLSTPSGIRKYSYIDTNHLRDRLCCEIAASGHHSTPPSLARLFSVPERRSVDFRTFHNAVLYEKEYTTINVTVKSFDVDGALPVIFLFDVHDNDEIILRQVNHTKRYYPERGYEYLGFSELTMHYYLYYRDIRYHTFIVPLSRFTRGLLLLQMSSELVSENVYLTPLLRTPMEKWVLGQDAPYSGPIYEGMRAVRVVLSRSAIFRAGELLRITVASGNDRCWSDVVCQVKQVATNSYVRSPKMVCKAGDTAVEIKSVDVSDSGLYSCTTSAVSYRLIHDHHVIVLPRAQDVNLYLSTEPIDSANKLSDAYPNTDALGRPYILRSASLVANCVYNLSRNLDNYNGYRFGHTLREQRKSVDYGSLHNKTINYASMFIQIHSYEIRGAFVHGEISYHQLECSYRYVQNFAVVRHTPPVPDEWTVQKSARVVCASSGLRPIILADTIFSTYDQMTLALRKSESSVTDKAPFTPNAIRGRIHEGYVSGSFISLHYPVNSWLSVCVFTRYDGDKTEIMIETRTKASFSTGFVAELKSQVKAWPRRLTQETGSNSTHQFVRFQVGWSATVHTGATAKMLWRYKAGSFEQTECVFQVVRTRRAVPTPSGFTKIQTGKPDTFWLSKSKVTQYDSGLYTCRACVNCTSAILGETRRLVVLPDPKEIELNVVFEKLASRPDGKPVLLSFQTAEVECRIVTAPGLDTTTNFSLLYETYVKPRQTYAPLPQEQLRRNLEKLKDGLKTTSVFQIAGAKPAEYWDHTRLTCTLVLERLVRDKADVLETTREFSLSQSSRLYIKERSQAKFLLNRVNASDYGLAKYLRARESVDANRSLFDHNFEPLILREGRQTLDFVVFMGIPRGAMLTWTVFYRGKTVHFRHCSNEFVGNVKRSSEVPKHVALYGENRGRHFEYRKASCVFSTADVALMNVILNAYDHTLSIGAEELAFKQRVRGWFEKAAHPQLISPTSSQESKLRTQPTYQLAPLSVRWNAVVKIGEEIEMIGPGKDGVQMNCWHSQKENGSKDERLDDKLRFFNKTTGVFRLVKKNADYEDSGIYACSAKQDGGFEPRELYVIPDENMVYMQLNHKPLETNQEFRPDYNQCALGRVPVIYSYQNASVRCVYAVSPFWKMEPVVSLTYRVFDSSSWQNRTYPSVLETDYVRFQDGRLQRVRAFTIIAPEAHLSVGAVFITCNFDYTKMSRMTRDIRGRSEPLSLRRTRRLVYKTFIAPTIFDEHLEASMPQLFDNFYHQGQTRWMASDFHRTGSRRRLNEDHFTISMKLHMGIPVGKTEIWMFYKQGQYTPQHCVLQELVMLSAADLPNEMKIHNSFIIGKGQGFAKLIYSCSVRPEHVALVIASYSVIDENVTVVSESLKSEFHTNIQFWLQNPKSQIERSISSSNNVRLTYRVQKLQIGWKGSVNQRDSWRMLMVHEKFTQVGPILTPMHFVCEHTPIGSSESKEVLREFTGKLLYFIPTSPARLSDTGDYQCNVYACAIACPPVVVNTPRRLVVLPKHEDIKIYINTRLLHTGTKPYDKYEIDAEVGLGKIPFGNDAYVYCEQQRIPGANYEGMPIFTVHMMGKTKVAVAHQVIRNASTTNPSVAVYRIPRAEHDKLYGVFELECRVLHDSSLFGEEDLREPKTIDPIYEQRAFFFEERVRPVIYNAELLSSNSVLQMKLQYTPIDPKSARAYRSSQITDVLPEAPIHIASMASLGLPRGWLAAKMYYLQSGTVRYDSCDITQLVNFPLSGLPTRLAKKVQVGYVQQLPFVNASFTCVIRQEHIALALIAYHIYSNETAKETVESGLSRALGGMIQAWHTSQSDEVHSSMYLPDNSNATYRVLKLSMGWNGVVNIGSELRMLGYLGAKEDLQVKCWYRVRLDESERDLDETFRVVKAPAEHSFYLVKGKASYWDSGNYRCNTGPSLSTVGFMSRHLEVLPDSSILRLFLTHHSLKEDEKWRGNYSRCGPDGTPLLDSLSYAVINCLYLESPGSEGTHTRSLRITPVKSTIDGDWLKPGEITAMSKDGYTLVPHWFQAPDVDVF
ncbi:hypothetical protein CLF_112506, partial [Clonorchis sinensis]